MEMMKNHVEGAVKMVDLYGGPKVLGLNGYLESLFMIVVAKVEAFKRASKPQNEYQRAGRMF